MPRVHRSRSTLLAILVALACLAHTRSAAAQPIGAFQWQLQPYCNLLTLNVTQSGGLFTLDGVDDLCGAAERASTVGIAFPNPDGTIGMGLTVVAPNGAPLHIDVTLNLATIGGSWRDSSGNTGAFVFTPVASGGTARPAPLLIPTSLFTFLPDGSLLARGTFGVGTSAASGPGARLQWYPGKAAFRAGEVTEVQWDEANIGEDSVALGNNTIASGGESFAMGQLTQATGPASVAMGVLSTATSVAAIALGNGSHATGLNSKAIGVSATASAVNSIAIGTNLSASGNYSTAMGTHAATNGYKGTFVYGDMSTATDVIANADDQFTVRAAGGVRFFSSSDTTSPAPGVQLAAGGGSWIAISDVHSKTNFRDVDGDDVLLKIRAMPIREWSYIAQDPAIRHIGPTAQDFRAAFGLGEDPLGIGTIDADGVALRAIQALEERTRALQNENAMLRQTLEEIRQELKQLLAPYGGPR